MDLEQINIFLEEAKQKREQQFHAVYERAYFYSLGRIFSFPRKLYFRFNEDESQPDIQVNFYEKYDYKKSSIKTEHNEDGQIFYKYLGNKDQILTEPRYRSIKNLEQIFKNYSHDGLKTFRRWETYFTFVGSIEPNPDLSIIIWSGEYSQLHFNKNLMPIDYR